MKKIIFILVASIAVTSCATIFSGTKDRITFNTNVKGAKIFIDGSEICTTPCTESIGRKLGDTEIQIKLDGYDTKIVRLDKEFNVISVLNLGNLLGWAIDVVTGSVMKYGKKNYDIQLDKSRGTTSLFLPTNTIFPDKVEINSKNNTAVLYVYEN